MDDPVKMYLKDIGKVPLLSAEQEKDLAKKVMEGDQYAKSVLCEANLRLVAQVCQVSWQVLHARLNLHNS